MIEPDLFRQPFFSATRSPHATTVPGEQIKQPHRSRVPRRTKTSSYAQAIKLLRSAALGWYQAIFCPAATVVFILYLLPVTAAVFANYT